MSGAKIKKITQKQATSPPDGLVHEEGAQAPRAMLAAFMAHMAANPQARVIGGRGKINRVNQRNLQAAESVLVKLRYGTKIGLVSAVGVPAYYSFRADCFDPDVTGAGGQPTGFDQWMAFYEKYRVLRYRMLSKSVNLSYLQFIAGAATSTGAVLAGTETVAEVAAMPFGKLTVSGGLPIQPLDSGWLNVWEVLGQSKAEYLANENAVGTASAIAAVSAYWQLVYQTVDATNTSTAYTIFELEMEVEFFDRTKLISS